MTFGHDDIRERLVEYLYEELEGPARAAFVAHLAGCATCRAEIEAAGQARRVARTVVRASVGDAVPLGLRARVLEAAATAARERAARVGVTAAPVVTQAASPSAAQPAVGEGGIPAGEREAPVRQAGQGGRGWLDRLRGRWTLPTFATVGALAAFLLVRGTIFREARRPLGEAPAERLGAPAAAPGAARAPAAAFDLPRARDFEAAPADGSEVVRPRPEEKRQQGPEGALREDRDALLDPVAKSADRGGLGQAADRRQAIGSLEGLGSGAPANAPAEPAKRGSKGAPRPSASSRAAGAAARNDGGKGDDLLDDLGRRSRPAPAAAPAPALGSAPRRRSVSGASPLDLEASGSADSSLGATAEPDGDLRKGTESPAREEGARFAQPPPAPSSPARVVPAPSPSRSAPPAPASASPPAAASQPSATPALSGVAPPTAEPARPASAPESPARFAPVPEDHHLGAEKKTETKAKKRGVDKPEAAAERADDQAAAPAAARSIDPALAVSDRAARLLAARRFTEASAAYRNLLLRFPDHPSAPLWRARLAASDRAAGSDANRFAAPPPPK